MLTQGPLAQQSPPQALFTYRRVIAWSIAFVCMLFALLTMPWHWHLFAVALLLAALGALAAASMRSLFLLAFPVYGLLGVAASLAVIESGSVISEQFRYGFANGSTSGLVAYAIGFLLVAHIGCEWLLPKVTRSASQLQILNLAKLVTLGSALVAIFYVVVFSVYGMGLLYSSRFDWIDALPDLVAQLHSAAVSYAIPIIFALTAMAYKLKGGFEKWMLVICLPLLALVGTGEKFGGFITIAVFILIGVGIAAHLQHEEIHVNLKHIGIAFGFGIALVIAVLLGYQRLGYSNVFEIVGQRLALQGHVWFGIFDVLGLTTGVSVWQMVRPNSLNSPGGLDFLSYLISDYDFVHNRIAEGVSFTMGGAPSVLAAFGFSGGLFIFWALGFLYAAVFMLILWFATRGYVLRMTLALVFVITLNATTQMGRWDVAYGTMTLAAVGGILVLTLIRRLVPGTLNASGAG